MTAAPLKTDVTPSIFKGGRGRERERDREGEREGRREGKSQKERGSGKRETPQPTGVIEQLRAPNTRLKSMNNYFAEM